MRDRAQGQGKKISSEFVQLFSINGIIEQEFLKRNLMSIRKDTWDKLLKKMEALDIKEGDIAEKFIRGSGKGGQKINKTDSCVYIKHIPTEIEIKCQETRSQDKNRYYARQRLVERIEVLVLKEKSKKQKANDKIRQQKKRRSRRSKQKMLEDKHHRGGVKDMRQAPQED